MWPVLEIELLKNYSKRGEMGWRGGREVQEGGGIRILMADSCCCTAETHTIL